MGDFTKNIKTITEGIRLGNLPEHMTDSVLERLPIQDLVRTSILSKKWRYKWTTLGSVVFDEKNSKKLARYGTSGRNKFIRVINQVFLLHKGSINKFYLYMPNTIMNRDGSQEVDQWMLFLSTKGVLELTLVNQRRYQLPYSVFSCLELRKLELDNCIFKPPLQFKGFLYLVSLVLKNINFTTELGEATINLPQLKSLFMHSCTNVYNLKLNATSLVDLRVINCPDIMLHELLRSEHLVFVSLTLEKPINDLVSNERMNLELMFTNMPKVQCFTIDGHFVKVVIAKLSKRFAHTVNSLKHLRLVDFSLGDLDHLHGALCLLRNSPYLETLCMMNLQKETELIHNGVETSSNHLKSPDCLDQTLNQLKTVELSPMRGSGSQLLFIKLLLAHAPCLEKFTIQSNGTSDANKRLNIANDVMRFPRASPKAEIIYLVPKPSHDRRRKRRVIVCRRGPT